MKGQANGLTSFANWITNFLITSLFYTVTFTNLGKVILYGVIAVFGLISMWYVSRYVGETRGLVLSECVKLYQHISGSENFKRDKEAITRMLDDAEDHP